MKPERKGVSNAIQLFWSVNICFLKLN